MANSLDAVSDRDFALEFLAAAAVCATHLSRFAEELVIWSSAQFRFVRLSDRFSTGSSIMPQKRNPDAAELIRAKVGRITGALVALLTVMKGLPLAYSKDMQEDKEQVFDAADSLMLALAAMTGMIGRPDAATPERLRAAAGAGFATATDLADWLVRAARAAVPRGAPRDRGAGAAGGGGAGVDLPTCRLEEMREAHPGITAEVYDVLGSGQLGGEPGKLRRHGAGPGARAGPPLAARRSDERAALRSASAWRCSRWRPAGSRATRSRPMPVTARELGRDGGLSHAACTTLPARLGARRRRKLIATRP